MEERDLAQDDQACHRDHRRARGGHLNNSSLLAARHEDKPILLAHRGMSQRFDERDLTNETCTAARMLPPTRDSLENTIRGIRAGFDAGADLVEIDATLFWALLASGQISMRKDDGWKTFAETPIAQPIDLAV